MQFCDWLPCDIVQWYKFCPLKWPQIARPMFDRTSGDSSFIINPWTEEFNLGLLMFQNYAESFFMVLKKHNSNNFSLSFQKKICEINLKIAGRTFACQRVTNHKYNYCFSYKYKQTNQCRINHNIILTLNTHKATLD